MKAFVFAVVLLLLGVSCGVPRAGSPDVIADADLPADLLPGAGLTPTAEPGAGATDFQIYMVGADDLLSTVGRSIERTPESIMDSLLLGTTPEERALGITSAITRETEYLSVTVNDEARVAFVDLAEGSLRRIANNEQRIAFAQIVYSLTPLADIEVVVFSIAGEFVSIPTDRGATDPGRAVGRRDFDSLDRRRVIFVDDEPAAPTPAPIATPVAAPIAAPDSAVRSDISIWMVGEGNTLVPVVRSVELFPESVLDALLLGPDIDERASGLRSAIEPEALAITVDVDESTSTALVSLAAGSLPGIEEGERLLAIGQIVFSLTELFEIEQVILAIDGQREPVQTDRGTAQPGTPVTRDEFRSLVPNFGPLPTPDADETPSPEATPASDEESG